MKYHPLRTGAKVTEWERTARENQKARDQGYIGLKEKSVQMKEPDASYDVIVIGAGHAGCEAALAAARMGFRALLLTLNLDNVAQMSCNPAIGGLAKGHIVREIDALGGEMAKVIDVTGIQFRMLNTGRGQAVQAIRAQADKKAYQDVMRHRVTSRENLELKQGTVISITYCGSRTCSETSTRNTDSNAEELPGFCNNPPGFGALSGAEDAPGSREVPSSCDDTPGFEWRVKTEAGKAYSCRCLILAPGTFLNGQLHIGLSAFSGGRAGELSAPHLSDCLKQLGFALGRLKTGTSPRLARRSIDFTKVTPQLGDDPPPFFSYSTTRGSFEQTPCYVTWTNSRTHKILRENFDRSPLFTGRIKGVGPRYCPSIEDKVQKFPSREAHQIFLEPEGPDSDEIYASGISTSMPPDVQEQFVRSIQGLEKAEIMRPGYAVEYDFVPPLQLKASLQTKSYPTLFLAGQINGTSGYEEAAAQGLLAGINAALLLKGEKPLVLKRYEGYIGVMIDDLVTRGTSEPYRMFTSQAEYRLLLRHDNADERLMRYGWDLGLVEGPAYSRSRTRAEKVSAELERLEKTLARPEDVNSLLEQLGGSAIAGPVTLEALLRRPEVTYARLSELGLARESQEIGSLVQVRVKYAGYIRRQEKNIEQSKKLESQLIPEALFTLALDNLSREAREALRRIRPRSVGQASRLAGVSPADVSALLIYLKGYQGENQALKP
jgi:tRNA uridine 5-carboxymethylaminomethyl modification enzyme